jgi:hypothetical protein
VRANFNKLSVLIRLDKKAEMKAMFNVLKSLDFEAKEKVGSALSENSANRIKVVAHLDSIKELINALSNEIDGYENCELAIEEKFIYVYVMHEMLKDSRVVYNLYKMRLDNLDKATKLVQQTYDASQGSSKNWYIKVNRVDMEDEKIASSKLVINNDGYELSTDDEIIKASKKELVSTVIKFRKFQRFVPEVSAGVAYTKLSFPKYSTETNQNTGKLNVVQVGEDKFKQFNFSSMINFNYYAPNTPLHPFWQIGIGLNADYPTLLTGLGVRLNSGLRRFALSAGFAGSWVKQLHDLSVNGEVKSQAELEKDLKYEFSFPLKPYIGIQLNF